MTNLQEMNELVGAVDATKKVVIDWAYMNRVTLNCLEDVKEFASMKPSIDHFINESGQYSLEDESGNWSRFLDAEYVEGKK